MKADVKGDQKMDRKDDWHSDRNSDRRRDRNTRCNTDQHTDQRRGQRSDPTDGHRASLREKLSLQWQLTVLTALMVIGSCLTISYVVSKSAILYMGEIEGSAIAILPDADLAVPISGPMTDLGEGEDLGRAAGLSDREEDALQAPPQEPTAPQESMAVHPQLALSDMVHTTKVKFWTKSLIITSLVTLLTSTFMYFIVGYALQPLQKMIGQIEEIQAKNLKEEITVEPNSSDLVRLTRAFDQMLLRLHNTFLAQRQFSANAAHELRTPLTVMRTKLELFNRQKEKSPQDYHEILGMVQGQTDRLAHVIDLLLEMTNLQTAEHKDSIVLEDLVEEVLCDLDAVAEKKGVCLVQDPGQAHITGNDTLIYRAIYNMVENAIKYNRPGGEVHVSLSDARPLASSSLSSPTNKYSRPAFVQVLVSDTGLGIPSEDWDKVFDPFFKEDKARSATTGGVGLGLALVQEIAHQHGGEARVLQSSPAGTQMALFLQYSSTSWYT